MFSPGNRCLPNDQWTSGPVLSSKSLSLSEALLSCLHLGPTNKQNFGSFLLISLYVKLH